ncbi:MAG: nitroreductase family protein, partial [Solobacterium sp.]|nr:nitroreductase family protein [Solobacterium sp.]
MEFKELIQQRRSVRNYAESISYDDLREILIQAQQAPSWANTQTARVYAVQSEEMLETFREQA